MPKKAKEKNSGKLQWFFLIFFVPSMFAVLIGFIILSIIGINVMDLGKQAASDVPIISSFIEEETGETQADKSFSQEQEKQLQSREQEIIQLEQELEEKEIRISELETEQNELEMQLEIEKEYQESVRSDLKELAQVYENMSAGKAASILSEMNTSDILRHMSEMKVELRGTILGKMEPSKASEVLKALEGE